MIDPVDEDDQAVAEAGQEDEVRDQPHPPREPTRELDAEDHGDGAIAADRRHRPGIAILERPRREAGESADEVVGDAAALLDRRLRDLRHSLGALHQRQIADHEHVRVSVELERRQYRNPGPTTERYPELRAERRAPDPGGPGDGVRAQPFAAAQPDAGLVDGLDERVEADLDPEFRDLFERAARERFGKRAEQPVTAFDEQDAHPARETRKVAGNDVSSHLTEHAGQLDAGRTAADHDEAEQRLAQARVFRLGRAFEAAEDVVAQRDGVLDMMQRKRAGFGVGVAVVLGRAARRDDQLVVSEAFAVRELQRARGEVDPLHVGHPEARVRQPAQDRAHRVAHVLRGQPRRRHLVQQRQEGVVVLAIDDQHVDGGVAQTAGHREPAEARADHDHARPHAVAADRPEPRLARRRRHREDDQRRHGGVQAGDLDGQTELDVRNADPGLRERQEERDAERAEQARVSARGPDRGAEHEQQQVGIAAVREVQADGATPRGEPDTAVAGRPFRAGHAGVARRHEPAESDLQHHQRAAEPHGTA